MKLFYTTIAICLLLQISTFPQFDPAKSNDAINVNLDSLMLDSVITQYKAANSVPGLTSLIYKNGQVIWDKNYGYRNLQLQTLIDDSTYFQIGSISKTFIAASIMQLWQAGLINLENDINNYLPSGFTVRNPNYPDDSITVKMLLVHTASIRTNWEKINPLVTCGDSPIALDYFLANYFTPGGSYYSPNNFYNYAPGSTWNYTNEGAGLLSLIVENLTGKSFSEYCSDSIFTPLSMNSSHWFLSEMDTSLIATPYAGLNPICLQGLPNYTTGFLRMTKSDMLKYLMAYLNYGVLNNHRILDSSTVALMLSDQLGYYVTLEPPFSYLVGFEWWKISFTGSTTWGRGGAWNGALAYVGIDPTEKFATVLFQNQKPISSYGNLGAISITLLNYAHLFGNIYALHPSTNITYAQRNIDPVLFRTQFSNINNHSFTANLIFTNQDSTVIDSIALFDDGLHGDSLSNDGIYGNYIPPQQDEDFFYLGVSTLDLQSGKYFSTPDIYRFTTVGPVVPDSIYINKVSDHYIVIPYLKNLSTNVTISNVSVSMFCADPWVTSSILPASKSVPNIPPEGTAHPSSGFSVYVDSTFDSLFNFIVKVSSDGSEFWVNTKQVIVGIGNEENLQPQFYRLEQNYPNPFNPSTKMKYSVPHASLVQIKVFDVLGNEIGKLVNEEKPAGNYELTWNAANLPSGVYFYQMRAGKFIQTKKMILLR